MEEFDLEEVTVKEGEVATPVIVLTGTLEEFEKFCSLTNRDTTTAIAIRQPYQIPMYPELPIVLYRNFWLNSAYDSAEYRDRIAKVRMSELEK